ncbi:MAG: glycosyltransferase family 4 protein [Candidatus Aminicenantes bacterium]|nr:MAG: glycosyltransferase family 4 protein [Candidatus Aminicenantes bacterium]
MIRVGIVVQRYGQEVVGGAESLARGIAERLNASGGDVTVFTTTAREYITWKNEFNPGDSILKGVIIKRFPVEKQRDIYAFNQFSDEFFNQKPEERDEMKWIHEQGPYSPALIEGICKAQPDLDVFLFFTYLYYPTIEGLKVVEKPVVLFPTAHDEPPIYLNLMKDVFKRPDALFFLTGAEMDFVKKTFQPNNITALIRTGTDIKENIDENLFKRDYLQYAPYILYAGRIEKGKGLEPVFEAYGEIKKRRLIDFVLIGKKLMDIPVIEGLKYVGFVSEEEKLSAFKGAVASVQPSPLESLSITTLESFSQETPVLVNKKSAVLCEHIELSGGGFTYDNIDEFIRHFYTLYDQRKIRKQMGLKGYHYVKEYFSWEVVIENIKKELENVIKTNQDILHRIYKTLRPLRSLR